MLRRLFGTVIFSIIGMLLLSGVCYAIGNPDYVTIGDAYVFRDVLEEGDQLYFVRYDVSYNATPDEDAKDTWQMALYNSSGSLIATRPLNYYQHNIISIYLTPTQALAWEGSHIIKIMGMPSIFDPLIEGTNMATRVLSPGDYYESTSLGGIMITQAEILETDWSIILLTSSDRLNVTGSNFFLAAVPGLSSMEPDIFSAATRGIPWERRALNTTGIDIIEENLPTSLETAIQGLNTIFGVTDANWGGFSWVLLAGLMVGGGFYSATRRPDIAILGGVVGTIGMSGYLGIASPNVMYLYVAIALFIVFLFTLVYVVPKMGG